MLNLLISLERSMVTYRNLMDVPSRETNEPLVPIGEPLLSGYRPEFDDMLSVLGPTIFVRESVRNKLLIAQKNVEKIHPALSLYVTYGYRTQEIQTELFLQFLNNNTSFFADPIDLFEEIHRYVAIPNVAGHPTGGVIDVLLFEREKNTFVDFGAEQYDFKKENCYVFSPTISQTGKQNRQLLRTVLMQVGFAPFDGEWWHFSYGDKEWAFYYKKKSALYDQIPVSHIAEFML